MATSTPGNDTAIEAPPTRFRLDHDDDARRRRLGLHETDRPSRLTEDLGPVVRPRHLVDRVRGIRRGTLIAAGIIVLLLVAARIAAPFLVRDYINGRLSQLDGYTGHVDSVHLAIWRGAYRLDNLHIEKAGGRTPVPFFSAPSIEISVQWAALFQGRVVADIEMEHPVINFVSRGGGADEQMGSGEDWHSLVDDMVPITINRFAARDGEIHYRDYGRRPGVDIRADRLDILAQNLSNVQRNGDELPSRLHVDGTVQSRGRLTLDMRLNPLEERPTFDLALQVRAVPMTALNPLLRGYAGVDAEGGRAFLYAEIRSRQGSFHGYVKPMVEGLSVFHLGEAGDPGHVIRDAIVGLITEVFENHGTDRLAVRVPVSGTVESPSVSGWDVLISALYNCFIQAFQHGLDDHPGWTVVPRGHR